MHNFTEFSKTYDARILDSSIRSMYGGNYYNVGDWEGSHKSLGQACIALTERHIEYLQPRPGWKVIDVGCGLGAATGKIAQTYPDVTIIGVNISHSQLSYAKTRYPSVDFCLMNACSLAIGNESLDGIISIEAAFHFPSRFDFLREAHRSLRSGGRMVFQIYFLIVRNR